MQERVEVWQRRFEHFSTIGRALNTTAYQLIGVGLTILVAVASGLVIGHNAQLVYLVPPIGGGFFLAVLWMLREVQQLYMYADFAERMVARELGKPAYSAPIAKFLSWESHAARLTYTGRHERFLHIGGAVIGIGMSVACFVISFLDVFPNGFDPAHLDGSNWWFLVGFCSTGLVTIGFIIAITVVGAKNKSDLDKGRSEVASTFSS